MEVFHCSTTPHTETQLIWEKVKRIEFEFQNKRFTIKFKLKLSSWYYSLIYSISFRLLDIYQLVIFSRLFLIFRLVKLWETTNFNGENFLLKAPRLRLPLLFYVYQIFIYLFLVWNDVKVVIDFLSTDTQKNTLRVSSDKNATNFDHRVNFTLGSLK